MAADQWISTQQPTKIGVRNGGEYGAEVRWVKAKEDEEEFEGNIDRAGHFGHCSVEMRMGGRKYIGTKYIL